MANRLSRRTFLKLTGVAGMAAVTESVIRPFGVPAFAQAAKPLTIGINAEITSLDPHHQAGSIVGNRYYSMIFDSLTQVDTKGVIQPMLATSWKQDDTTWKFQLRPGVKFQDGSTMTAKDVAFSLNRLLNSDKPSQIRASFKPFISKIEATGDLEVTITTPRRDGVLPLRLATPFAAIMPQAFVEAKGFDAVQKEMIGAGPYKVVNLTAGNRVVMEAHKDYWGGAPVATQVTMRFIPETATRIAALRAGEVDMITTVAPDQIAQIDAGNTRIDAAQVYNWMLIYFNTNKGVTKNVELRKALSLSIDRDTIAKALWGGRVRVLNDYYLPGEFGYEASRKPFAYDLEAAKKALAAAGYAGEELEFTPPSVYYTNGRLVTDAINEMWQAAGVKVKYEPLETAKWAERSLAGNTIATLQSFGTSGDPATGIGSVWAQGSWVGQYYTPSEEFTKLSQDAAASTDEAVRRKNYRAIADILDRDVPIAPLYQSVEFYGVRKGITWEPHQNFQIDLRPGKFSF